MNPMIVIALFGGFLLLMMLSVILAIGFVLRKTDRLGNGAPAGERPDEDRSSG
ncbi:hypothetical protein [Parasphingopyxis marina]|uniref:Uncharacterized protein n=1 Tax=Parasphingopyxis marina TaxID=2761622 RepID=A0A842HZY0_9SPHN|nr:hypothetical protein [Parasphingopyxis marina]MBC2778532.1 hypothetical protein [Parasphingopyxis marina]